LDGEAGAAEYSLERSFASLISTTRDVLLSPRRFFDGLAPDGPLWPPVIYFLICHLATTLINLVATALKRGHGISTGKTLGAVLVPLALSLVLAAFGIFFAYRAAQDADLTSRLEVPEKVALG
jgi:hypothetical protein